MNVIAIIGLGNFALNVLDQLISTSTDLIILDKDREIVEKYKKFVSNAYIADAINSETLKKIIPENLTENASKIRLDSEKIPFLIDFCSEMRSKIIITERKQIAFIKIEVAFAVDDSEMSR